MSTGSKIYDKIVFTDMDGPADSGEFAEHILIIQFTDFDRTQCGLQVKTNVDVTLKRWK